MASSRRLGHQIADDLIEPSQKRRDTGDVRTGNDEDGHIARIEQYQPPTNSASLESSRDRIEPPNSTKQHVTSAPLSIEERRVLRKRLRGADAVKNDILGPVQARKGLESDAKSKNCVATKLPVYVSDAHNGALVNLQCAIRCKEIPFSGLAMLHVDSHPDLMVPPDMPAKVVFRPRELHEHLANSETGIAEFILPGVYAGHISSVAWLRAPWSNQIRDGEETFHVGDLGPDEGPLRVSTTIPYYYDEGLSVSKAELHNVRALSLWVSDAERCASDRLKKFLGQEWFLDICLDYFSVNNPFLVDLESKLNAKDAQVVFQVFAGPQLDWRRIEEWRTASHDDAAVVQFAALQEQLREVWSESVLAILEQKKNHTGRTARLDSESDGRQGNDSGYRNNLDHHENEDEDEDTSSLDLCVKLGACFMCNGFEIAQQFHVLVKKCTPDTKKLIQEVGFDLDLPHHPSSKAIIAKLMVQLQGLLESVPRPRIVTIAKSSSDEFDYTPKDQIDSIFNTVLDMLENTYGPLEVDVDPPDTPPPN